MFIIFGPICIIIVCISTTLLKVAKLSFRHIEDVHEDFLVKKKNNNKTKQFLQRFELSQFSFILNNGIYRAYFVKSASPRVYSISFKYFAVIFQTY